MKIVTADQYSPKWWAARRGVPSASNAKKVFTSMGKASDSQSQYIADLIAEHYDPCYGNVDDYQSAAMKNGSMMEPEARRFYEFDKDVTVEQVGFCVTDDGRFGASPDGLVGDDGGLECKAPQHNTQIKYLLAGQKVPADYIPQVHWTLIVTGRKWWDFLSYTDGLPKLLVRVTPDDYTQAMRAEMEKFWTKYQAALNRIREMDTERAFADHLNDIEVAKMF